MTGPYAPAHLARLQDEVAAAGTRVASEMSRRRAADAVAAACTDFVCPITQALMSHPVVGRYMLNPG